VIESFKHRGLKELFNKGRFACISPALKARCLTRLDALDAATRAQDMNVPGFDFHALKGKPKRYSVHVSGNWCLTFEWRDGGPARVNLEDCH
jgi:proteic killer suppression protein